MENVLKVTFKGIDHSDEIEEACHKYFKKLEQLCDRITSCHVVVSARDTDRKPGTQFHYYRLTLRVPGGEIVISHDTGKVHSLEEDARALRETFERARARLDEFLEKRRDRSRLARADDR